MKILSRGLMVLSLGLWLASCVPGRIDNVYIDASYEPTYLSHVPFSHSLWAVVSGNPFPGTSPVAFADYVNHVIQAPGIDPDPNSPYHMIFVFNRTSAVPFTEFCDAHPGAPLPPPARFTGEVHVAVGMCWGGKLYSSLVASVSDISDVNDPKLAQFLRYLTVRLFPNHNAQHEGQQNCVLAPNC
ncbi:MAG TPA: hypothetical protein VHL08_10930 [Dongiaceae bacterium]|jgi:hypothetical protein|nr:hypothetical protein [Dongiaceae bacterium]